METLAGDRKAEQERRWRASNPERVIEQRRRWQQEHPEKVSEYVRRYKKAHPEKVREQRRRYTQRAKDTVFEHYGTTCACCSAGDDLQIDHLDPELGDEHRRAGLRGANLCFWLINNNFPPGFQTLCRLCNMSKRRGTHCTRHPLIREMTAQLEEMPLGDRHALLMFIASRYPADLSKALLMWRAGEEA